MATTRVQTALKFFSTFDPFASETLEAILTPNFEHFYAPSSPPRPPLDKTAYLTHMSGATEILDGFPMTIKDIIQDAEKNQVVVWTNGHPKFKREVVGAEADEEEWTYVGEYVFMFTMDESGEKIQKTVEFVDSKATDRLRGLLQKARANKTALAK